MGAVAPSARWIRGGLNFFCSWVQIRFSDVEPRRISSKLIFAKAMCGVVLALVARVAGVYVRAFSMWTLRGIPTRALYTV